MLWRYTEEHTILNCYVCANQAILSLNRKNRVSCKYKSTPAVSLTVQHSDLLPIPPHPRPAEGSHDDEDDVIGVEAQTAAGIERNQL